MTVTAKSLESKRPDTSLYLEDTADAATLQLVSCQTAPTRNGRMPLGRPGRGGSGLRHGSCRVSLAPQAQQAVLAAGGDRGAVGAPVDAEDLVRVARQLQLQLPGGHVPHLREVALGYA